MPLKQSEAIVLRTYPMREADLLVTLFTREAGKLRGVARSAKKSKKRFGGALEPLTFVLLNYEDREGQELVRLDSCEVLESPLSDAVDYGRAVALGHIAEVLDELLPDHEAHDDIFRLAVSVLSQVRAGSIWLPLTYFDLWTVRLTGLLSSLEECVVCGERLNGNPAYFHPLADGLMCAADKRLGSQELTWESRQMALQMFRSPIEKLIGAPWPRAKCADLRRFLLQRIERLTEKKLVTAAMLDRLD
jgi:DNA repair protein RecO (recombination protein O)